jgi:hypothetical protein
MSTFKTLATALVVAAVAANAFAAAPKAAPTAEECAKLASDAERQAHGCPAAAAK